MELLDPALATEHELRRGEVPSMHKYATELELDTMIQLVDVGMRKLATRTNVNHDVEITHEMVTGDAILVVQ